MRGTVRFALALVVSAVAGCGYSPNPLSGKLLCGQMSSCPDGYACVSGTCWRPQVASLLGHWVFDAGTKQVACSDGSSSTETIPAGGDYVDIVPGTKAVLATTDYFCPRWELDANGSTTVIESGQGCTRPDPTDPTINEQFRGETFTLAISNGAPDGGAVPDAGAAGAHATLYASLPYSYSGTAVGTGTCTLKITGDLTKN
jgi:hypothetical protein